MLCAAGAQKQRIGISSNASSMLVFCHIWHRTSEDGQPKMHCIVRLKLTRCVSTTTVPSWHKIRQAVPIPTVQTQIGKQARTPVYHNSSVFTHSRRRNWNWFKKLRRFTPVAKKRRQSRGREKNGQEGKAKSICKRHKEEASARGTSKRQRQELQARRLSKRHKQEAPLKGTSTSEESGIFNLWYNEDVPLKTPSKLIVFKLWQGHCYLLRFGFNKINSICIKIPRQTHV